MDLSIREAISKLASSTVKCSLKRLASSRPTKVLKKEAAASIHGPASKHPSSTAPVVTPVALIHPSSTLSKEKGKAVEDPGVMAAEMVSPPGWLSPLMVATAEFYPPHLKVQAASMGEAQTSMMQNLILVGSLIPCHFPSPSTLEHCCDCMFVCVPACLLLCHSLW